MKKLIQITIIMSLVLFSFGLAHAAEINITIDGKKVEFDQLSGQPFIDENSRTQVPFRQVLEAFGAEVSWDNGARVATAKKDGITVEVPIGEDHIFRNGLKAINDTSSLIKESRTYLPIRIVLEAFGATIYWDNSTKTVIVESKDAKRYDYDLSDFVKLGKYKGLEISAEYIEVTDEEVSEEIDYRLASAGTVEWLTSGQVKKGDVANIDFVGTVDGKRLDGGTGEGIDLTIGSGQFIPGFEDGLIGKNIGSTVVLKLTFPEGYTVDLSGKRVDFAVTVNSVSRAMPVKLNTEFVKANSDFETVKEYRDYIKDEIKNEKSAEAKEILWGMFYDDCEVTGYPEKELKYLLIEINQGYRDYVKSMQMEWNDFLDRGMMTPEDFDAMILDEAHRQLGDEMIIYALARQEKLELTESEYNKGILRYLNEIGYESQDAFERTSGVPFEQAAGGRKYVALSLMYDKILELLIENATPTNTK